MATFRLARTLAPPAEDLMKVRLFIQQNISQSLPNVAGNVSGKGGVFRISEGDEAAGYVRLLDNFGDEFTGLSTQSTAGDMQPVIVNFDQDFRGQWRHETEGRSGQPENYGHDCNQEPPHGQV
jgi:hypothetical protein